MRAISREELESVALQDMLADVGVVDARARVAAWRDRSALERPATAPG